MGAGTLTALLPKTRVYKADKKKAQTPGGQHRIDHAAIEEAYDEPLDDEADQSDNDWRDDQHRDVHVYASLG